jgi:branched-chain amino acid transport system substrate-binding protein
VRFDLKRFAHIGATAGIAAVAFCCAAFGQFAWVDDARAELVVGVGVPSRGLKSQAGHDIRSAAEREVLRINAAGGIDGETLQLAVEDDDCTGEGGARVAASFVRQRAMLVLGHPCSNAAIAAANIYAGAGVWFVAIGAGHPDLTVKRAGATIFRLGGRDDRQAGDTAAVLLANQQGKRIAIVHDRTAYARTLADGVARGLKAAGQPAIAMEGIVAGKMHYGAAAGRLKVARAEVIYFAGFPNEYEIFRSDMKAAGIEAQIVASDAAAGNSAAEGSGQGDSAGKGWVRLTSQPHHLADGSRVVMARQTNFATTCGELVLASIEAFRKSARNLTTFALMLGVDANGDSQVPAFAPAIYVPAAKGSDIKACNAGDCP